MKLLLTLIAGLALASSSFASEGGCSSGGCGSKEKDKGKSGETAPTGGQTYQSAAVVLR